MKHAQPAAAARRAGRATAAAALAAAGGATAEQPAADAPTSEAAAEEPAAEPAAAAAAADDGDDDDDDCECPEGTAPEDCDCDDEMDDGDADAQAARSRETARCVAIFTHPNAKGREGVAAKLATNRKLTRSHARALLADMGPVAEAPKGGLAAAMSTVRPPKPNAGGSPADQGTDEKAVAAGWDRSMQKFGRR